MRSMAVVACIVTLLGSGAARAQEPDRRSLPLPVAPLPIQPYGPPAPPSELACDTNGQLCVRMVKHGGDTPPWSSSPRTGDAPPWLSSRKTHSPGLAAGGAVLGTLGLLSLVGGALLIASDHASQTESSFPDFTPVIAWPLIFHGLGCIGAAVPMMAIGLKQIQRSGTPASGAVPSVSVGAGKASVTWSF